MILFLILNKDADVKALWDVLPPFMREHVLEQEDEANRVGLCKILLSVHGGIDGCLAHFEQISSTVNTGPRMGV